MQFYSINLIGDSTMSQYQNVEHDCEWLTVGMALPRSSLLCSFGSEPCSSGLSAITIPNNLETQELKKKSWPTNYYLRQILDVL